MVWEKIEGYDNLHHNLIKNKTLAKKVFRKVVPKPLKLKITYLRFKKAMKKALAKKGGDVQQQKVESVAIIFIGTNKYIRLFSRYYNTINKFFIPGVPKDFFVFTNKSNSPLLKGKKRVFPVKIKHENTTFATMMRFKKINSITNKLKKYSHVIYIDSDMFANYPLPKEIFFSHNKPLFGVQHPFFVSKGGTFEKNPKSTAAIRKGDDLRLYRQGCFWGGQIKAVLELSKTLEKNIDVDLKNKVIASWLDESHLNRYFLDHQDMVHTYPPNYAYPLGYPIPRPFRKIFIHGKGNILK